jgi:hypothetical protein
MILLHGKLPSIGTRFPIRFSRRVTSRFVARRVEESGVAITVGSFRASWRTTERTAPEAAATEGPRGSDQAGGPASISGSDLVDAVRVRATHESGVLNRATQGEVPGAPVGIAPAPQSAHPDQSLDSLKSPCSLRRSQSRALPARDVEALISGDRAGKTIEPQHRSSEGW